jgi:hypothetical protein
MRESSPAATVPDVVPVDLVAAFPRPRLVRISAASADCMKLSIAVVVVTFAIF